MIKSLKSKSYIQLFIISILFNLIFAKQNYKTLDLTTSIGENKLNELYFNDISANKKCDYWIPALFNPVLLVDSNVHFNVDSFSSFDLESPIFSKIDISLFHDKFFDEYNLIYAKNSFSEEVIYQCYFGLSKGLGNYQKITENEINLNMLKDQKYIGEKIFSFDKWTINENNNTINSFLYLGDIHENFLSKNGIIGTCNAEEKDSYWGCTFKEMKFNDNIISLMNNTDKGTYYKIFFSSENHLIIFPKSFEKEFNKMTNNICKEDENKFLYCNGLFNSENYISMKLIDDNMIITIEVDNSNRFTSNKSPDNKTRIKFEDNEFFIFPLIMFKNFHIQFNLKENKISFYTNNKTILELKKEEEDNSERKEEENDSTNVGKIILIIFIIILILVLGFGVFWFVKKKRASAEKNINKYNKFEEDDNFKDMNEKRVF